MKKIIASLFIVLISVAAQAQLKMYEYPSGKLTEEMINQMVDESRQSGTKEWELQLLKANLMKRLALQSKANYNDNARAGNPPSVQASCNNIDFENNSYSGWTLTSGDINYVTLPCNTCASGAGGIAAITSSSNSGTTWTNGIDNCSGQPAVAPGGGVHSLCLNDNTAGGKMQEIQQTFNVTSTNNIFTYQYLAVLQDGGHAVTDQPYFNIQMLNQGGTVIACTKDLQSAAGSALGWTNGSCSGTIYKGWKTVTIDLTAYINQNVTIQLIVSDCNQGGHYGYAYIDASCGQLNYTNNASICSGASANLCGPTGYATYTWTGPQTGSAQCLSTTTAGTYTCATTSSLGCPSPTLIYTVNANPAVVPNFSVATTPCNLSVTFTDHSTISSGTITNWSWNFGDGQTATSTTAGNTQPHTYTAMGSYTAVMTCTSAAGCVGTYSTVVNLNGSLSAPATTASVACNAGTSGSATVTPTGGSGVYTYTWSPSGGSAAVATGLGAGTYTCAISDGAGCNSTTTVTITQPTALSSTSTTVQTTCGQFNGSATVSPSGGNGPYTYTWSPSGGNTSSISGVAAGTYTCNVSDANLCPYTAVVNITNQSGPAITAIASSSVTCYNGTNGTATVTATGTVLTYSWSPSGGSSSSASGLSNGSYTVAVTDANSCVTSSVVTVNQATDIIPTSSVTASACGATAGSATVSATGGNGSYSYTWTPSGGNTNVASNLGAGSYVCTITDGNNCVKTVSVFITTTSGPTATIAASSSVTCNNGNNGSATVSASGGTGTLSYTWAPSGGNGTTANGLPAGSYTCVVMDANQCLTTSSVTINQPTAISSPVVTTSVSCNGGTNGVATVNASGGTGTITYTWVPSGGNASSATGLGVGTYTCNMTDANGCTTNTIAVIAQPTALSASVTTTSVSCNGGNNGVAVASASGGVGPYQYTWAPTGGNNAPAINLTVGTYTTHITDANNCSFNITSVITGPTAITSSSTFTNVTCHGAHNGIGSVNPAGGTGAYTYSWSPTGGSGATTTSTLGAGTFTCTIKDGNGCILKSTVLIVEPPVITITSTTSPAKCFGASNGGATVNVSGGTPTYTVSWNSTPPQTGTAATGLHSGTYTATVIDAAGCSKTKTVNVTSPEPKDSLEITGSLCSTDPNVLLNAPQGTGINTPYQWYSSSAPISGASASTYTAVQANISGYAVTWLHNGCLYVTKTINETIYADLATLPQTNVFTPNGDKINDDFYPFAANLSTTSTSTLFLQGISNLLKEYEIFVYDRWGILMYSTTEFMKGWDGKHAGKDAPDGTYYWIVNYKTNCNNNTGRQKTKGFVQLLR